ncbi:MAG: hypothetical protein ACLRSY_06670 [Acutalibacter sp.]
MKKGNRWAALLLALACAGSLAACQEKQADEPEEQYEAKPVVYLYPEEDPGHSTAGLRRGADLHVPAYNDGWTVIASPDGTLTDGEGQTYSYLYWEGKDNVEYDFSQGACVAGEDTAAFLEDALSQLGLTRREANEFMSIGCPRWRKTPITSSLSSPTPTRKRRSWPLPQPRHGAAGVHGLKPWRAGGASSAGAGPERSGFTVVEWGGCQVK